MSDTISHLVTLGCGVLLGVIVCLTVLMVRDMMKDKDNGDY